MCFSATANFVGSAVLGTVGVITLTKVKHHRELMFASLPILFAVHQFVEGFVWLGLDGILSPAITRVMGAAFMLYAQGILPFLLPLSVWLFEPTVKSRRRMLPFLLVGIGTALYILWALTAYSFDVYIRKNSLVYVNSATNNVWVAVFYVIATCGSLFFSRIKDMVVFGAANLVILLVVMAGKRYVFISLWCAYAALASVIILAYFWKSIGRRPFQCGSRCGAFMRLGTLVILWSFKPSAECNLGRTYGHYTLVFSGDHTTRSPSVSFRDISEALLPRGFSF